MLSVSMDCLFVIAPSVFSNVYLHLITTFNVFFMIVILFWWQFLFYWYYILMIVLTWRRRRWSTYRYYSL